MSAYAIDPPDQDGPGCADCYGPGTHDDENGVSRCSECHESYLRHREADWGLNPSDSSIDDDEYARDTWPTPAVGAA